MSLLASKYPCPCCGYQTHAGLDSLWEVCAVCHWENEPITLKNPYYNGGPNSCSLVQAQQNFILFEACDEAAKQYVRSPRTDEPKDKNWRPFGFDKNLGGQTNKNLSKNIHFDDRWQQDWHTITTEQYGITSEQKGMWILANQERFSIELTYNREPNACDLIIKESEVIIFRYNSADLEATKIVLNSWIEQVNAKIETILENQGDEKKTFEIHMLIHKKPVTAKLTCWINADWGHNQIRNARLQIGKDCIKINYTFSDFERMLFHIQRNELSDERLIHTCFFCRYSTYNVAGNDDFGDLNCFKSCKEKIVKVKNKHDVIDLFESEVNTFVKVAETHHCQDYADVETGDYLIKLLVR